MTLRNTFESDFSYIINSKKQFISSISGSETCFTADPIAALVIHKHKIKDVSANAYIGSSTDKFQYICTGSIVRLKHQKAINLLLKAMGNNSRENKPLAAMLSDVLGRSYVSDDRLPSRVGVSVNISHPDNLSLPFRGSLMNKLNSQSLLYVASIIEKHTNIMCWAPSEDEFYVSMNE